MKNLIFLILLFCVSCTTSNISSQQKYNDPFDAIEKNMLRINLNESANASFYYLPFKTSENFLIRIPLPELADSIFADYFDVSFHNRGIQNRREAIFQSYKAEFIRLQIDDIKNKEHSYYFDNYFKIFDDRVQIFDSNHIIFNDHCEVDISFIFDDARTLITNDTLSLVTNDFYNDNASTFFFANMMNKLTEYYTNIDTLNGYYFSKFNTFGRLPIPSEGILAMGPISTYTYSNEIDAFTEENNTQKNDSNAVSDLPFLNKQFPIYQAHFGEYQALRWYDIKFITDEKQLITSYIIESHFLSPNIYFFPASVDLENTFEIKNLVTYHHIVKFEQEVPNFVYTHDEYMVNNLLKRITDSANLLYVFPSYLYEFFVRNGIGNKYLTTDSINDNKIEILDAYQIYTMAVYFEGLRRRTGQ